MERRAIQTLIARERELRSAGETAGAEQVRNEVLERYKAYNLASKATRPVKLMADWELLPSLKLQLAQLSAAGRHWEAGRVWRRMVEIERRLKLQARARRGEIVLLDGGGR
jgi:hypothetical protein